MSGAVESLANTRQVTRDARCCFVMAYQEGLDFMVLVFLESRLKVIQRDAFAPGDFMKFHVHAKTLGQINPEVRKLSKAVCEDFVTP